MINKLKAFIAKLEATAFGQRVFRFVRLVAMGVVTTLIATVTAGTPITAGVVLTLIVAAAETAFRTVFPGYLPIAKK